MTRKLSILLAAVMLAGLCAVPSFAAADSAKAQKLIDLGVMNTLELERAPTRAEMMTMFIRLLGKEAAAIRENNAHPFTDVADWANANIGWMYANKLTNGIGNNLSGAAQQGTAQQYITFVLRGLGYSDAEGDFTYADALPFAQSIGLLTEASAADLAGRAFLRGDMADISFDALSIFLKDKQVTLADKLIVDGVIEQDKAIAAGVKVTEDLFNALPLSDSVNGFFDSYYLTRHPNLTYSSLRFQVAALSDVDVRQAYVSVNGGEYTQIECYPDRQDDVQELYLDLNAESGKSAGSNAFVYSQFLRNTKVDTEYSLVLVVSQVGSIARLPAITASVKSKLDDRGQGGGSFNLGFAPTDERWGRELPTDPKDKVWATCNVHPYSFEPEGVTYQFFRFKPGRPEEEIEGAGGAYGEFASKNSYRDDGVTRTYEKHSCYKLQKEDIGHMLLMKCYKDGELVQTTFPVYIDPEEYDFLNYE
jgi:hypothetical protein